MKLAGKRGTLVASNRMEWLDVSDGLAVFTGTWRVVRGTATTPSCPEADASPASCTRFCQHARATTRAWHPLLIPRSQVRSLPAHLGRRSKRKRAQHPGSRAECRGCDEAGDPVAEHGRGEVPVHQPHDFNADEFQ
jgi:hypothetical protein